MDIAKTIDTLFAAKLHNLNYARAFLYLSDCNKEVIKLTAMAMFLGGTKTMATHAIGYLCEIGLITSRRWDEDKRHLEISVTNKGKDLAQKLAL